MKVNKRLSPSMEDYLEAILILEKENRVARVKEIAAELDVQMPSVTGALKNLKEEGLINYEKNSYISLTCQGMDIALSIQDRHTAVELFLRSVLRLDPEESEDIACKIEHSITPAVANRLRNLTDFIEHNVIDSAHTGKEWKDLMVKKPRKQD